MAVLFCGRTHECLCRYVTSLVMHAVVPVEVRRMFHRLICMLMSLYSCPLPCSLTLTVNLAARASLCRDMHTMLWPLVTPMVHLQTSAWYRSHTLCLMPQGAHSACPWKALPDLSCMPCFAPLRHIHVFGLVGFAIAIACMFMFMSKCMTVDGGCRLSSVISWLCSAWLLYYAFGMAVTYQCKVQQQ
jgi:hypothetical protein